MPAFVLPPSLRLRLRLRCNGSFAGVFFVLRICICMVCLLDCVYRVPELLYALSRISRLEAVVVQNAVRRSLFVRRSAPSPSTLCHFYTLYVTLLAFVLLYLLVLLGLFVHLACVLLFLLLGVLVPLACIVCTCALDLFQLHPSSFSLSTADHNQGEADFEEEVIVNEPLIQGKIQKEPLDDNAAGPPTPANNQIPNPNPSDQHSPSTLKDLLSTDQLPEVQSSRPSPASLYPHSVTTAGNIPQPSPATRHSNPLHSFYSPDFTHSIDFIHCIHSSHMISSISLTVLSRSHRLRSFHLSRSYLT